MGGKKKLANAQAQANVIAQQSMRQQAAAAKAAQRIAVRTAQANRQAAARQNQALIAAERRSAAALAALANRNQERDIRTEVIDEEDVTRRKEAIGGRRSAYGFARPFSGAGLGGAPTNLG